MGDEMGRFLYIRVEQGVFRKFWGEYFLFSIDGFQHKKKNATDKQPLGYSKTDSKKTVDKAGNRQFHHFVHQHTDEMNPDEDSEERDDKSEVVRGKHPVQFFLHKIGKLVSEEDTEDERKQWEYLLDETVFKTFENSPYKRNQKQIV